MGGGGAPTGQTTPGGMQITNSLGYDPSQTQGASWYQDPALVSGLQKGLGAAGQAIAGSTRGSTGSVNLPPAQGGQIAYTNVNPQTGVVQNYAGGSASPLAAILRMLQGGGGGYG